MIVDVYHSGMDRRPRAPLLFVPIGQSSLTPRHPEGERFHWTFWKSQPLAVIAVEPPKAARLIDAQGFFIQ